MYYESVPFHRPVHLEFNEAKAAQAAAYCLRLRGGEMNYMKLIKLLYLADRKALDNWGRPITTDNYVSMRHGPVLSRILNLIRLGPETDTVSPWTQIISKPRNYAVSVLCAEGPPDDELSQAELDLIAEVFAEHGSKSPRSLVNFVHNLPEWKDPGTSSIPIEYADILKALGKDNEEIALIEGELAATSKLDRLCAPSR